MDNTIKVLYGSATSVTVQPLSLVKLSSKKRKLMLLRKSCVILFRCRKVWRMNLEIYIFNGEL